MMDRLDFLALPWPRSGVWLFAAFVALVPADVLAETEPTAAQIHFASDARRFDEVLKDFSAQSGIRFHITDSRLGREVAAKTVDGKTWTDVAKRLLEGYNYMVETGAGGDWQTVTVSGKNGDGKMPATADRKAPSHIRQANDLPARYQKLKPGAVMPIKLPLVTLKGMKKGQKIKLDLPIGPYELTHDKRFGTTLSFSVEPEGQPYRAMISLGPSGPMGHLVTTQGNYDIFTEDGQTYLLDIQASGLEPGSLLQDQAAPGGGVVLGHARTAGMAAQAVATGAADHGQLGGSFAVTPPVTIDLLVLHSKNLPDAGTRVNYLAALANQAFLDSGIHAQIRVVYRQAVDYSDTNDNAQALSDLSAGRGVFRNVSALRDKYGADLVTLLRPFHAASQKGCGIAWVNGSNGSELSAERAYSVVGDGTDADGGLVYCGAQTLAHELGHNFGNVHDRLFSDFPGVFAYSYAWGIDGVFGTIMSYRQPGLLLYATPQLANACQGQPCGYPEGAPNASDNARTINQTAPIVAGFRPDKTLDKF